MKWVVMMSIYVTSWFLGVQGQGECAKYGCSHYEGNRPCQCDSQCLESSDYDCCDDYESVCLSCETVGCGAAYNSEKPCQCLPSCVGYSDCCNDYPNLCENHDVEQIYTAPSNPSDRRDDKSKLRVISYNADWLFTEYSHSMGSVICPGSDCAWPNTTIAKSHLAAMGAYISDLNPDILIIPETSDSWILEQLINAFNMSSPQNVYSPFLVLGRDTYTGQNSGLITKIDPTENLVRNDETMEYPVKGNACGYTGSSGVTGCSKHFQTRMKIAKGNDDQSGFFMLTIAGLHLLAFPTDPYRCVRREAQALLVAPLLKTGIENGDEILVGGDWNDYDADTLDSDNDVPTSRALAFLKNATSLYSNNTRPPLQNAMKLIGDQNERYSEWYDANGNCIDDGGDEHSEIDHLLLSKGLFNAISSVTIDHRYAASCASLYSDHWPVIVDFDLSQM